MTTTEGGRKGFGIPEKAWRDALNAFLIRRPWLSDVESRTAICHILEGITDVEAAGLLIDMAEEKADDLGLLKARRS